MRIRAADERELLLEAGPYIDQSALRVAPTASRYWPRVEDILPEAVAAES